LEQELVIYLFDFSHPLV